MRNDPVGQVTAAYDRAADRYVSARGPISDALERLLERLMAPIPTGSPVFDVGCGSGVIARYLVDRGCRVTGLDTSACLLAIASKAVPEGEFVQKDMRTADFERPFDALVAWDSVFHVPRTDHGGVFRLFHAWLRPGGRLLLSLGGSAGDFTSEMLGETFFYSGHDPEEALRLLAAAGLCVEHWEVDDRTSRGHVAILATRPAVGS